MKRTWVVLICMFLAACSYTSTQSPSSDAAQQPSTATDTPIPILTSTVTSSPLLTATPAAVLTPIPVPRTSYEASNTLQCPEMNDLLAVGYADFNRDGREDILTAHVSGTEGRTPVRMLLQNSSGSYLRDSSLLSSPSPGSIHARKVVIGDFNKDNLPDAFIADHGFDQPPFPGAESMLLISKDGALEVVQIENMPIGFQHSATAADFTGDGAPDIFVMDSTNGAFLLLNDGTGIFTVTRQRIPSIHHGYYTSEFIDLDKDGFYDLLVGGHEQDGAITRVYWGDTSGTFTTSRSTNVPSDGTYRIVLDFDADDLDGDGNRELLITRTKSQPFYQGFYFQMVDVIDREFVDVSTRIVPNNANWEGSFARWIPWIILRDFDDDGYSDVVIPNNNCALVYLNDGKGNFTRNR